MKLFDDASKSWARWGEIQPYFAVLSNDDRFRLEDLDDARKQEFFESGEQTIASVLSRCEFEYGTLDKRRAIDFGCGCGRLVLPLAQRFDTVIGIDIAPGMRRITDDNACAAGLTNVSTLAGVEDLEGGFDFIHSVLVFQHIPCARGYEIFDQLCEHLAPGGVAALHVPLKDERPWINRALGVMRRFTPLNIAVNLLRGRDWREPLMRMYVYDANRILLHAHRHGIQRIAVWVNTHDKFPYAYFLLSKISADGPQLPGIQEEDRAQNELPDAQE